ncbi:MAG: hypothetical protein LBF56_01645 [Holosporales bacterium]|nr:hypothetical protein [Holosporales bacterium]
MKNFVVLAFAILFTVGCDKLVEHKYLSSGIKEDSVKKMMSPVTDEAVDDRPRRKPVEQIVIPEELKQEVSLVLNETLPIKSVLHETAKRLNINFQMDPSIDARVIFQAKRRPFIEMLDAICDIADLRYTISGGIVKVSKDIPYSVAYDVQFLNFSRDSENKISITTEVGGTTPSTSEAKGVSSDSNVTISAKSDFWNELDCSLRIIMGSESKDKQQYSVNRQSGIVTIRANSKVQHNVREYLEKIKESTMSQVLIEAKIIEIILKNEYRRGINWNKVSGRLTLSSSSWDQSGHGVYDGGGNPITLKYNSAKNPSDSHLDSFISALEEFGTTRTISNPRITVMNNQAAILKVAKNHVYFKLNYEKSYLNNNSDRQNISVSSDIKTVPLGLIMFVQPSIDLNNRTITLFLRPTITKLAGTVSDPAVNIAIKNAATGVATSTGSSTTTSTAVAEAEKSNIPITEVREVASVLKLNDGEIAVLGGFMESRSSQDKAGLPGYKDIPVAGELVSSTGLSDQIVELVILIKVILSDTSRNQRAADIRLQRFVPDPRPF